MTIESPRHILWKRFTNSTRLLLSNRLAATGLVILLLFGFLAITADILTPYHPQDTRVAAPFSPPAWARSLPGYEDKSENIAFTNLDALGQGPGTTATETSEFEARITFDRQAAAGAGGTALVKKTVEYPYNGAAGRFVGRIGVNVEGVSPDNPVNANLYFRRVENERVWPSMWNITVSDTNSSKTLFPPYSIDSNVPVVRALLGYGGEIASAAAFIFARPATYEYVLELTFPSAGPAVTSATVSSFEMNILGTSFGLLGTNHLGNDLFTQIAHGARVSLSVGLLASLIAVAVGLLVGITAGFLGRVVDETLMRFTDMLLVIPGLPLIIVLIAVLGPSFIYLILIIGLLSWEGFARVIRSQVLSLKERPYVEAARASGAGTMHVMGRHIFPNLVSLTYVALATAVPGAILTESGLSFLGLFDPRVTSWGRVINEAFSRSGTLLAEFWWWILPPGIAIALVSLSFVLIGYALDEIFNPKLRKRR